MKFLNVISYLSAALLLQGCFTGVESTPRISASDVRRVETPPAPEDSFLRNVMAQPFAQWMPGKKFKVADNKIRLLFGATIPQGRDLAGTLLTFTGFNPTVSFTGDKVTDLYFVDDLFPADTMVYRVNFSADDLLSGKAPAEIPFTVDLDLVSRAGELLLGKKLYILTRNRRDDNDNIIPGRKFAAVTIDSVLPGNAVNPLKVVFTDDRGDKACVFLASGDTSNSPRTFRHTFSFSDPRKRYPAISDHNWELISEGKVAEGMTRDECRLALGNPATVDRRPGYSYLYERWGYENGIYLIFEDGLLKSFRR
ncbi:MAG: hypothetical protein NC098_00090 [Lachnoclostridium sp.]|nr:hypothetical protein [Lachnoclostridium sp.]